MWSLLKILIPFMGELVHDRKHSQLEEIIYHPMNVVRSIMSIIITLIALVSTTGLIKVGTRYLELEDEMVQLMNDCKVRPIQNNKKI